MKRWVAFAVAATVGLLIVLFSGDVDAKPRPVSVGVTAATWDYHPGVFSRLAQAGATWTRVDIVAARLDDPAYVAHVDRVVADARTNRLRILGTLWGSPRRADVPPADWYVARARLAAARWRLDAWEVWNEPDARLFWHGTPEQYGRLLRLAYPVLRSHGALVVHAGLAHNDPRWLRRSFGAGARFDVLGAHPYPTRHTASPARALRKLTPLHRLTRKPIWITELGWSTCSGGVSEAQQARNVTATLRLLRERYAYVERVFFFEARDTAGTGWLSRLGLLRRDLSAKPALSALGSA